ncbi:MAG: PKD domain-containing protein [bacterium]
MSYLNHSEIYHYIIGTLFLLSCYGFLTPIAAVSQTPDLQNFNTFPVARHRSSMGFSAGKNTYPSIVSLPDSTRLLIAANGNEDILDFNGKTFRFKRFNRPVNYRSVGILPGKQEALLVGNTTRHGERSGRLLRYGFDSGRLKSVRSVDSILFGAAFSPVRGVMLVGGDTNSSKGSAFLYRNGQLKSLDLSITAHLHDAAWKPTKQEVLVAGDSGTVGLWSQPEQRMSMKRLPYSGTLRAVAWNHDGTKALIGGDNGTLYRYESGNYTRITTDIEWDITDIEWQPGENQALFTGRNVETGSGYLGLYRQFRTVSTRFDNPMLSLSWFDDSNALIGGKRTIYRLSKDASPSDFGLNASITIADTEAVALDPLTLSGYGSTYRSNADDVAAYRFDAGNGVTTSWRNNPDFEVFYDQSGTYTVQIDVRGPDQGSVATDTETIVVRKAQSFQLASGVSFFYWWTFIVLCLALSTGYILRHV